MRYIFILIFLASIAIYIISLINWISTGNSGSASCLVACKEMGFDYVGFEIDKEYWTIANERLGRAYYQPELFGRSG